MWNTVKLSKYWAQPFSQQPQFCEFNLPTGWNKVKLASFQPLGPWHFKIAKPKDKKSLNWHPLITFRYSSSAACILRRRRVHFFQSWLSLPLGYTCGVHWGSEAEGGIGFEPCWYWNSWYQFIVFNFKPRAWTANKFANLHFPPLCFHEKKQYGIVKFVLQCFFQQSSSWIELWFEAGTWFLVLRNSEPKFLTWKIIANY